jgi:dephospho-CoA kinase
MPSPNLYYDRPVHVFGLTGGISSGKSTVAARFRERGVPVVDADQLARDVVGKGSPGLEALVREFGVGVLAEDGSLDRKKLGAIVFADSTKRMMLNAITHPLIAAAGAEKTRELAAHGEPLTCYEAALLLENGLAEVFRPLVVVAAPEEIQVERTIARDGLDREEALARVRAQMPLADKIARADVVIMNDSTKEELVRRADLALLRVCEAAHVPISRYPAPAP